MRFRTKLFLGWALTVLIPLAAIAWPLTHALQESFEHAAETGFAGTNQSLAEVQTARVNQMRQASVLVMNIPELRALIAESSIELSKNDLVSLQDRLDDLASQMQVRFLCVFDGRGALVAQNHGSPWKTLDDLQQFAIHTPQPQALVRRLYAPQIIRASTTASEEGLWVYDGGIYEVVGIPLVFADPDSRPTRIDGALIVALPLSDKIASDLAKSHDCQITFLANGRALASSLPMDRRDELEKSYARGAWPQGGTFNIALQHENFLSSVKPLTDASSGTRVGDMLIQTSTAVAQATQHRVLQGLAALVLLALLAALAASYLLSGVIVRPVRTLVQGARKVAEGDLNTVLPVQRGDELGQLTVAFNEMVAGLRRQKELQTLIDETQAANKAKSRFLANMSHEIRTPLHGVVGMSELLLRTDMSDRQRRYVSLLKSSAELLTKLINDVLDFSKAEAGKLELESVDFDLHQLVDDAVELMAERAHSKRLQLGVDFSAGAPSAVRGDPTRLRQILLNLLSNALKFTDAGAIKLRVICPPASDRSLFKFEIQDTGIGIPRDRMSRLFQSFSQVDASTTRRFGGTGLGLAICKQLAELMGGQIGVESVEGKGSTFWFTARLHDRVDQPAVTTPAVRVGQLSYFTSKNVRILLVEDQEINCIVASELLTEAGFAHDVVHDGKAAVDAVLNGNYQLVLMDCQMPGLDGMEATRRIRHNERQNHSRPRIPIIALTANTSGAVRDDCIAAGMDGFCSKPFTTRELFDAMAGALAVSMPPDAAEPHRQATQTQPAVQPSTPSSVAGASLIPAVTAATNSAGAIPPFDMQTVLQRCSGKSALAGTILEKFQSQATTALANIQSQIAAGNAAELARASHAVKGTAGLLGATSLQSAAARLEEIGRARDLASAHDAVEHLRLEVERCVQHIRAVKLNGGTTQVASPEDGNARSDR